jgi:predicted nucleic acid-binding protein
LDAKARSIVIISDAGPLIQFAILDYLNLLPKLYTVIIPKQVFEETQYYKDLPDAIEIAKAAKSWLIVKPVKKRSEVSRLMRKQKLGRGESEAIILCKELEASAVLTSDRYAAERANDYGIKTLNIADIIRQSYNAKILTSREALKLIGAFINQDILDTQYIRELEKEAKSWP